MDYVRANELKNLSKNQLINKVLRYEKLLHECSFKINSGLQDEEYLERRNAMTPDDLRKGGLI